MLALILAASLQLLTIHVSSPVCLAPCEFVLTLSVEPAADNAMVSVEVDSSSGFYRYSELDYTSRTPKTTQIRYIGLPEGHTVIRVLLYKHDAKTWLAATKVVTVEVK